MASSYRQRPSPSILFSLIALPIAIVLSPGASAQTAPASSTSQAAPNIGGAWDQLLGSGAPQAKTDPILTVPQKDASQGFGGDFINHFYFETRTDYWRYNTSYTNNPTTSGVINATDTGVFNPDGIPYSPAFQSDANRLESFVSFGTRGWLSSRVNTHFALRYYTDLSHVNIGSSAENIVETFSGNRRAQLIDANIEINGLSTQGALANTSLTLGRQAVYGAEFVQLDGAALEIRQKKFDLELYGGQRFSLFGDPAQRGIGGANLTIPLSPNTSVGLETLWYLKGSNSASFRHRFNNQWLMSTYFRAYGGSPVDFGAQAIYSDRGGKTTLRLAFFQKLSSNDYTYDNTIAAREQDPHNPLLRLYLGQVAQASQFSIDARRTLSPRLRLGGSIIVHELDSSQDQGPFDTSFQDYRANAQVYPLRRIETFFEYHQRNSDRLSPANPTSFDDIKYAGETRVQDLTADIRRSFGEGRFNLSGGVYYRRVNLQDRFFFINGVHQSGWLASGWVKIDPHTRFLVDYDLDNDFFLFTPDIKNSRALHVGFNWKY